MRTAALSLIFIILFTGCATIIKGTTERVIITSVPSGAEVHINGEMKGETPLSIDLVTDHDHEIIFKKEGYKEEKMILTTNVNNEWVLMDIIVLVVPVFVDWSTGDWKTLESNEVQKVLTKSKE